MKPTSTNFFYIQMFTRMNWLIWACAYLLIFTTRSFSQDNFRTVTGKVTDRSSHLPLTGITIRSLKTNITGTSAADGSFSIRVSGSGDTLQFSHVGYTPLRLPVDGNTTNITIELSAKSAELEEVVITNGYQNLRPNEVTGSVQVIPEKLLRQQTGTNVLQRLNNLAPGVRFSNRPVEYSDLQKLNISIRGLSTINGPLDPLIVLDGFIYEGNIENIDPNLVENITLLKDAAAASIWGARAGNGVIVITTKKGQKNKRARIEVNKSVIFKEKPDLNAVYQLPAADFIGVEAFLFQNGYYDRQIRRTPYLPLSPAIEIFLQKRNGWISAEDSAAQINALASIDARKQYAEYFLNNPVIDQYTLNVSGSTGNNSYALGAGYTTDRNEYDSRIRKINLTAGNTFRPLDKLSVDLNVYFTRTENNSGKPTYTSLRTGNKLLPYTRFADDNGNPLAIDRTFRQAYMNEAGYENFLDWNYYPLEDDKHSISKVRLQELFATASLRYQFASFLNATVGYQVQQQETRTENTHDVYSAYARTMINQFSVPDPATGVIKYNVPKGGIRETGNTTTFSSTLRGQVNVNRQWVKHSVIAIAGAEMRENLTKSSSFTAYGFSEDPLITVPVDYVTAYPTLPDFGFSNIPGSPSFGKTTNRFVSLYANMVYLFDRRYSLSLSGRRDGANIFGQQTNDKWKPLWSVGGAWNLSGEKFYGLTALPTIKIRATYGYSGNVDLRKTPLPIAETVTGAYTNYPASRISLLNDPSLRWERISTLNIGTDFTFRNGIVSGSIDFYRKRGKDLYGLTPYDYTAWGGFAFLTKNVAGMKGKGIEAMINFKIVDRQAKWNTSLIFNYTNNKTSEYFTEVSGKTASFLGDGSSITPVVGKPLNAIAAFRWAGLDQQGNPQGFLDGKISTDYFAMLQEAQEKGIEGNLVYKGSAVPLVYGSVVNSFSWKGFSFDINISFRGNYYFRKNATSYQDLFSRGVAYADFLTRWMKPGDELITTMPSMQYTTDNFRDNFYQNAEINVLRADHIRLEYINLNYAIPRLVFTSIATEFYANISNLGILWRANDEGIDPEFSNRIPPLKAVTLGARLSF